MRSSWPFRAAILALALAVPLVAAGQEVALKVAGTDVPVPKRTRFVAPQYPASAQAQGLRGIVILELVIDEQGKVASVDVVRSVPPFDEAAVEAVRQWEYEVTRVDGKPVRVRHTLPITFALRLPALDRQEGVPELRQGAGAAVPQGVERSESVRADVTLLPDGSVADAAITRGESPFAEALLAAIRTWRFAPETEPEIVVSFRVEADFVPGRTGTPGHVDLKLKDPKRTKASTASASSAPSGPDASTPSPAVPSPAATAPAANAPAANAPASTTPTSPPSASPAVTPPVASAPPSAAPSPSPAPTAPGPSAPVSPPPSIAPPPVDVIGARPSAPDTGASPTLAPSPAPAPTPASTQPGFSAVRDVTLGPGVPDLSKGRRPVVPPLARMAATTGAVEIQMAVDAAGGVSVQNVSGPELLKEAARQTAQSWGFRRTSADRIYLVATFTYAGDQARAEVRRAQ